MPRWFNVAGPCNPDIHYMLSPLARTITPQIIERAKEILIERQDTHLDSLAERLREPCVRRIIEPMLAGLTLGDVPQDDRRFLLDLGLVRRDPNGGLTIANPIYSEVIPRVLAQGTQDTLPRIAPTWLKTRRRPRPGAPAGGISRLLARTRPGPALVIFDQRAHQPPSAERTTTTPGLTPADRAVVIIRA